MNATQIGRRAWERVKAEADAAMAPAIDAAFARAEAAEFLGDEPWQGLTVVDALFIIRALSGARKGARASAVGFWPDVWERTLLDMVYGDTPDVTRITVETTLAVLTDNYGADDPPPRGPIIDRAVRALKDALAMLQAGPPAERGH